MEIRTLFTELTFYTRDTGDVERRNLGVVCGRGLEEPALPARTEGSAGPRGTESRKQLRSGRATTATSTSWAASTTESHCLQFQRLETGDQGVGSVGSVGSS